MRNGVVEQKNLSLVKLGMSLKISSESRIPVSQTWRGAETSSDFHNPNRADMRLFNKATRNWTPLGAVMLNPERPGAEPKLAA